jgi:hypothetical protein
MLDTRAIALALLLVAVIVAAGPTHARADLQPEIQTLVIAPTTAPIEDGDTADLHTIVRGDGALPSGAVTLARFASSECTGDAATTLELPLVDGVVATSHESVISNNAGWDSATTWRSNNVGQYASNWHGSVFMGNDTSFFWNQSSGWRFTGLPLLATDSIDDAYLSLRIRKTRPNLNNENYGVWKTVVKVDRFDGSDFDGLDRPSFLQRFNSAAFPWQVDYHPDEPDPFGTGQGATFAVSPSFTPLVQQRIAHPDWQPGDAIAVGIINDGTEAIAEAALWDEPDHTRLHLRWTRHEQVAEATAGPLTMTEGEHSFRATYDGDAAYAAAAGPCVAVTVLPRDTSRDGYADNAKLALSADPLHYCPIMRADVNHDGAVNILDLALVAGYFGQQVPPAPHRYDQGPPGQFDAAINIIDLSKVGSAFGAAITACP